MAMSISEDTILHWLWLQHACGPCSAAMAQLLERSNGVESLYCATRKNLEEDFPNLNEKLIEKLLDKDLSKPLEIFAYCRNNGITVLTPDHKEFPSRLLLIPSPPCVLYVRGRFPDLNRLLSISIVGTRRMTDYGSQSTYLLAHDLAKAGTVIISGMAKGVDGIAHRAALDAGGTTVAVFGCGVNRCYPPEHVDLMNEIIRRGAVISEFPPFTPPSANHFPIRNRIISGISQATVITEADERSGALITARHAVQQGRDLFALPGKIGDRNSVGPNHLLREGAITVTAAMDILSEYHVHYKDVINIRALPHPGLRSKKIASPIVRKNLVGDRTYVSFEEYAALHPELYPDRNSPLAEEPLEAKQEDGIAPTAHTTPRKNGASRSESTIAPSSIEPQASPPLPALSPSEEQIFRLIPKEGSVTADELTESGLAVSDILITLTTLEIKGVIESLPGNQYRRR